MESLKNLELLDSREYLTKDLASELDDFPLLTDLNFADKLLLAQHMQLYRAAENAEIFHEGDSGNFICFLIDGKVDLVKESDDGGEKHLGRIGPGKTIGEMSLIDGEHRSATARCITSARIAVFTKAGFERLVEAHLPLAFKLMCRLAKLVSQRLRLTTGQLVDHLSN